MDTFLIALGLFLFGYTLNMFYITVLYHRGLCHGAVSLKPWAKRFTAATGNWVTGIDPKAWACMHRMHHEYSDTDKDPHSPKRFGLFGLIAGQYRSYSKTLMGLQMNSPKYANWVKDLEFKVNWMNRYNLWVLPYVVHASIGLALGAFSGSVWIGLSYWLGIMSHPVQGWLVNAFAHWYGYRNFKTADHSQNNWPVAFLVFGEGLQNNHHHAPESAKFAVKWWEPDFGYALCKIAQLCGMVDKMHVGIKAHPAAETSDWLQASEKSKSMTLNA